MTEPKIIHTLIVGLEFLSKNHFLLAITIFENWRNTLDKSILLSSGWASTSHTEARLFLNTRAEVDQIKIATLVNQLDVVCTEVHSHSGQIVPKK